MSNPVEENIIQPDFDTLVVQIREQIALQATLPHDTIMHRALLSQVSTFADKIPQEQLIFMMEEVKEYGRIITIPSEAIAAASAPRPNKKKSASTAGESAQDDDQEADDEDLDDSEEGAGVQTFVFTPVMPNLENVRDGYIYIPYVLKTD